MPSPEDLTARARIRDAAMAEFATRGTAGATIRGIAERAGVSPALVQHHFGTKDGLRDACDAHALEYLAAESAAGFDDGRIGDPAFVADVYASSPPVMRYLARALVDGSPAAATVFDRTVDLTQRYLVDRPGLSDARTRAVVYTAMRLGALVLHDHLSRALGADVFGGGAGPALGRATLDLIDRGLVPDGVYEQARDALDRFEEGDRR